MRKLSFFHAFCFCWALSFVSAEPLLEIGEQSVVVEGLTPGGSAVFFYVERDRRSWRTHVSSRAHQYVDEDGDGEIGFRLNNKIAFHSVWCVVDLTTGEYDIAVPDGFPRKERGVPGGGLTQDPDGLIRRLRDAQVQIDVLLVRPNVGVWRASAGDGAEGDDDGVQDGASQVAFSNMQPIDRSPEAPSHLERGDTLIVINPKKLVFFSTRIAGRGE